ncbi:S-adenosyl-L-methionine-dependent tRNA 4-demethylwyosine synthase [Golovinomyces cichoracearum]|uniref:tRNA 4-demethylwyosine synthase (AdoMet-dependent) n=1 Tax=Golovinomyces cichoracearum TaxID=62708 RepID=A0A420HPH9_9PEZI|nr:S-adenosyl-L-methionine-dependent tRNA 4-demethylwyosine synthase [Golovinomyces cichoracearum]
MNSAGWNFKNFWSQETKTNRGQHSNSVDPVELWHIHRFSIFLIILTIFVSLKLLFYFRATRENHPSTASNPKIISVEDSKKSSEKDQTSVQGRVPKRIVGGLKKSRVSPTTENVSNQKISVLIFYSSVTGTTKKIAQDFTESLARSSEKLDNFGRNIFLKPELIDLAQIVFEDYFLNFGPSNPNVRHFYLFLLPTYNIETILDSFLEHLLETHNDFRIETAPLSPILGYSVFGFGDQDGWPTEKDGFCSQAIEVDKWMARLTGGKRAFPLGMGDSKINATENLEKWKEGIEDILRHIASTGSLGEGVIGSGDAEESDLEETDDDQGSDRKLNQSHRTKKRIEKKDIQNDLEDIGSTVNNKSTDNSPQEINFTHYGLKSPPIIKEMVPKGSPTHKALTKQGYSIVGSHSGVKICRWTKSALRGRGSCYKYSFYGIASHQCMETTPSLSCSNKCVFCWRHGTNPVGTTWRWVVDPPELIFNGVKAGHYQKIKMMRGVPGVRSERFSEAMRIRHCALSLVGEPIFYPYINEFLTMLHAEHISSFLVCNAQHPDQLASLKPVTQLYVSIDASNRESLRKIDRPLHHDFWERFNRCLDILRQRRFEQRTVFRLTLVKGFNIEDEIVGYADLIEKSLPCFVEIKGVTYCGTSSAAGAGLTMQNVPFYDEICTFVESLDKELNRRGLDYGIAAEHAHSCCVLIASKRFQKHGKWHTRIDYDNFFRCLESGEKFRPEDYMGLETPEWATWGNGGFDPRDERVFRKGKNKVPLSLIDPKIGALSIEQ